MSCASAGTGIRSDPFSDRSSARFVIPPFHVSKNSTSYRLPRTPFTVTTEPGAGSTGFPWATFHQVWARFCSQSTIRCRPVKPSALILSELSSKSTHQNPSVVQGMSFVKSAAGLNKKNKNKKTTKKNHHQNNPKPTTPNAS